MSDLKYIFVHGLSGWGSYDNAYRRMPYWGMRGGDLIAWLRAQGFSCYAASVSPTGSAWDRACELYAQLAGTCTDYGEAHARMYRHARFGRDFSGQPLLAQPIRTGRNEPGSRLVLLGHSFGGATIRVFADLMLRGSASEKEQTPSGQLSPLFAGDHGVCIHSLVTLAAPHNGTTAYDLFADPAFDPTSVKTPLWSKAASLMMSRGTRTRTDERDPRDYAGHDMHIDNADAINRQIGMSQDTYYFSVPCSATRRNGRGDQVPDTKKMEPLFVERSFQIGVYTGQTAGGIVIDDTWKENDGLVNTLSSRAPSHAPGRDYDPGKCEKGIWQVMPVHRGDHMSLQGGLLHTHDIRGWYLQLLQMIDSLL